MYSSPNFPNPCPPANVLNNAFNGVAKDNFTLEVPESAISQYQATPGWCDFKRIAAHHELVCRPSVACALSTEHKQKLVINAEGEWEVASKLDAVAVVLLGLVAEEVIATARQEHGSCRKQI